MDTSLLDAIDALRREIRDAAVAQIAGTIYAADILSPVRVSRVDTAVTTARDIYRAAEAGR